MYQIKAWLLCQPEYEKQCSKYCRARNTLTLVLKVFWLKLWYDYVEVKEVSEMIKLTKSLEHWLWVNHKDKFGLILFGHTELFTEEMEQEYLKWCQTEEGKQYLKGGKYHAEP